MNNDTVTSSMELVSARTDYRPWGIVLLLLLSHASLLVWSALSHSPNVNEPSHIVAGLSHWEYGRFDLYNVNPPLIRMIATLPILAAGSKTDWSQWDNSPKVRSEFLVGPDWVAANGVRSIWLTALARFACMPMSLVGGVACYMWARDLYGIRAGLLSCCLWCFSPNILGHASCITPDAHAAAIGVTACYVFWRWLRNPNWSHALIASVLLGITLLTKITWIFLLLLWPMIWAAWNLYPLKSASTTSRPARTSLVLQLILIMLGGLHVLNTGYAYDGSFRQLGGYSFVSSALKGATEGEFGNRFSSSFMAYIPVPFPEQFILGADIQKQDHERHPVTYFRGQTYRHGFWFFYLYAFALKVPVGTLVLLFIAMISSVSINFNKTEFLNHLTLLAPLVVILLIASSETDYTTHFRYVLPCLPFAYIWAGKAGSKVNWSRPLISSVILFATVWVAASSLWCAPHWLGYFNEFAGGPAKGHFHLANSNLDWGQDLLFLKQWQSRNQHVNHLGLAYYGMYNPRDIGINFTDVPGWIEPGEDATSIEKYDPRNLGPRPGWYAVSTNFIVGHPFWQYRADGTRDFYEKPYFTYFSRLKPVDRAGYSIRIFHVTDDDIERLAQGHSGVSP